MLSSNNSTLTFTYVHMSVKKLEVVNLAVREWRSQDDLNPGELAMKLGVTYSRAAAACLGLDWNPSLREVAKIETAIGMDLFDIPLKTHNGYEKE